MSESRVIRALEKEVDKLNKRIEELEGKIERAKDITNSQSFWCELADKECVGMKSIVHLVEQALGYRHLCRGLL